MYKLDVLLDVETVNFYVQIHRIDLRTKKIIYV